MYELQIPILLLLLLHLAHLLLPHTINDLQFLPLLDPFLILVTFLHQLLHVVVDILVNHLQLTQLHLLSRPLILMQPPHQSLRLHFGLQVVINLHPALEVVGLDRSCLLFSLSEVLQLLVYPP